MAQDRLQGLRLPTPEEAMAAPVRRRQKSETHYLMETPDGELMSVSEDDLDGYLQRYGTPQAAGSSGS